uniref:Helicase POLQ-like n=1 Tax=Strongyloides papillosus TaxID=174720 RepID=A0A0N5BFC7_STREA
MSNHSDTSNQIGGSKPVCFVKSWQILGLDLDIENNDIVSTRKRKLPPPLNQSNIVTKFKNVDGRLMECSQKAVNEFTSPCVNNSLSSYLSWSPEHQIYSLANLNNIKDLSDKDVFSKLELPSQLYEYYLNERNISNLYDWQKECLCDIRLLRGSNIILSLPTGAGKTMVAELLMLREVINNKKSCIIVLPYVAIVQEKMNSLMEFKKMFDIEVLDYAAGKGAIPPVKSAKDCGTIYVATIEKANILVNSLIANKRINEIGLVVVDELHMIGESMRGVFIEQMITKYLMSLSGQIIGMSATLDDMTCLKKFMKAHVLSVDFRPVRLDQKVKILNKMYYLDEREGQGKLVPVPGGMDNNLHDDPRDFGGILPFLKPIIPNQGVLIFCPTKESCENLCGTLSEILSEDPVCADGDLRKEELIEMIRNDNGGRICEIMEYGILAGVCYHHSGITVEERDRIETAFKSGIIHTLCATSTLAAGVNLPARRVIVKDPFMFDEVYTKSQYTQMVGRAGRAGLNSYGDSITIITSRKKEKQFREMIESSYAKCRSQMVKGSSDYKNFQILLLDMICLSMAKTRKDLEKIMYCTLYGYEHREDVIKVLNCVIAKLLEFKMIKIECDIYAATPLGLATQSANFSPGEAVKIKQELDYHLENGVILSSVHHWIYILLKNDISLKIKENKLHNEMEYLERGDPQMFSKISDVSYPQLVAEIASQHRLKPKFAKIYAFLMIRRLLKGESIWDVAKEFSVQRGSLQNVLQSFYTHARCIIRFSEKIPELWSVCHLSPHVIKRLFDSIFPTLESLRFVKMVDETVYDEFLQMEI